VFDAINHICVVTADIERAVRVWADRYGVGPWSVYTFGPSNMRVVIEGTPVEFGMRVGLAHVGANTPTRMEIIQPLDDRSPYAASLAAHGGANHIHHVRLDIADHDAAVAQMHELGLRTKLSGRYAGRDPGTESRATYLSTEEDLGFTVEVAARAPDFPMPEPDFVYPPTAG